jgi:hypothetical protein
MTTIEVTKTQYRVADFIRWQKEDSLVLSPYFQRRYVWKPNTKSYFIDTVLRGWPSPIICIRGKTERDTRRTIWEVVDGQQRLRTLFSYIDESLLEDFNPERDRFTVQAIHNPEAAGKQFDELPERAQKRILSYQLSTHVLPGNVEDHEVLEMFARLNSAAVQLNHQEMRNANYAGVFKTAMYELGLEQLERWREWKMFTEDEIARMKEVELTSDLVMNMVEGLTGKTQPRLDDIYEQYDDKFTGVEEVKRRFGHVMDVIDELIGDHIRETVYAREAYFFTLFAYLYDVMYGLGSSLGRREAKELPPNLPEHLLKVSEDFRSKNVPEDILYAVQRASRDFKRRKARLQYMASVCNA